MKLITQTNELSAVCAKLAQEPYIAVDTEFMRESTYWPILCLIQVAGGPHEALIDPMSKELDLTPFMDLMANEAVIKVLHASRQDLEIFFQISGDTPKPLFDTQVASMALGLGDQVAYDALVREFLGQTIDKGSRFTDWSRRPLSDKQLSYALSDVTHLRDLYPMMIERLEKAVRLKWAETEMAAIHNHDLYQTQPTDAWKRMKLRSRKPSWLAAVKALAEWRESEAQSRDVPRNRILKDDAIYAIAQAEPRSESDLGGVRGVPNGFERSRSGRSLMEALSPALKNPAAHAPKVEKRRQLPDGLGPTIELLKVLLRHVCESEGVSPKMIATVSDLEQIAAWDDADVPALKGWRREVFGEAALKLKRGETALKIENGQVITFPVR